MISSARVPQFSTQPDAVALARFKPQAENLLPKETERSKLKKGIVGTGNVMTVLTSMVFLLSPLITKKNEAVLHALKPIVSPKYLEKLKSVITDPKRFQMYIWRTLSAGYLLLLPMEYETSLNTKQPSMLAYNLISTVTSVAGLFTSSLAFRALAVIGGVFYRAGKQNDIANSANMNERREWDLHRLTKFFGVSGPHEKQAFAKESFFTELENSMRFIFSDVRRVFIPAPWKALGKTYQDKTTWTQPNSDLMALSGQFAFVAGIASLFSKAFQPATPILDPITKGSMVFRDTTFQSPIITRAWQNRDELEGKLLLFSTPVSMVGSMFLLSKKYFFLSALSWLANPFWMRGINLNSQHRLAALDYIRYVYQRANQNPTLKASDVLNHVSSHPEIQQQLRKKAGKSGLTFIMQTLQDAEKSRRQNGISLERALYPITVSKD